MLDFPPWSRARMLSSPGSVVKVKKSVFVSKWLLLGGR